MTQLYRERIPEDAVVLDLMSSWVSHLPPEKKVKRVVGHGMNAAEVSHLPVCPPPVSCSGCTGCEANTAAEYCLWLEVGNPPKSTEGLQLESLEAGLLSVISRNVAGAMCSSLLAGARALVNRS